MAQSTQVREIRISIDTSGDGSLKSLANSLGNVNQNTKKLAAGMDVLKNAFVGYFAFLRVRELADFSDSMQQLHDRLTVLTGDTGFAGQAMQGLLERANRTKTSIDDLGNTYTRLSTTTEETGITQNQLLDVTEVLQNTFRLSGATAQEAANASVQLSQGFALGVLRGQDLKSVLSQNVVIGKLLADTFKVQRTEIRTLAESGFFTADKVMRSLYEHMDQVNTQAAGLTATFSQTLTVAVNELKFAIFQLNEEYQLSAKFADAVGFAVKNAAAILSGLAVVTIPFLIAGIQTLWAAFTVTPFGVVVTGIALVVAGIVGIIKEAGGLSLAFSKVKLALLEFLEGAGEKMASFFAAIGKATGATFLTKYAASIKKDTDGMLIDISNLQKEIRFFENLNKKGDALKEPLKLKSPKTGEDEEDKLKEILGALNKEYLAGSLAVDDYYKKLDAFNSYKITREFREGKTNLDGFRLAMEKLTQTGLNREFEQGNISIEKFNSALEDSKIREIEIQFHSGKLSVEQFEAALVKTSTTFNGEGSLRVGLRDYINSVGTLSSEVAKGITSTFTHLEDVFVSFIKTGKANFADFANAVLDDLTRIIVRAAIVQPLARGILSGFSGGGGAYTPENFSTGDARTGYLQPKVGFLPGSGNTQSKTSSILPFPIAGSSQIGGTPSTSQAGVTVNVINNAGADVQQSESTGPSGEKVIDVLIQQKVQQGFATGAFDKTMKKTYGLNRRGS